MVMEEVVVMEETVVSVAVAVFAVVVVVGAFAINTERRRPGGVMRIYPRARALPHKRRRGEGARW